MCTQSRFKPLSRFKVSCFYSQNWCFEEFIQRIDAFELWCWRLLGGPWTARKSNQSILKEISPEYSLEGMMLRLELQYFGHLMWRTDSLERSSLWERLKAGGKGDDRGWDGWMASPIRWTWVWASSRVGDGQGGLACCSPQGHKESDTTEWLNWTETSFQSRCLYYSLSTTCPPPGSLCPHLE